MLVQFVNYGIYTINIDYLKYLYDRDHNVYYSPLGYSTKPFLGIVAVIKKRKYFIPFTSSKQRHVTMRDVGQDYYLVTDKMDRKNITKNTIYKDDQKDKRYVSHIIAQLDLRKMIPVPDGLYHKIDFEQIKDPNYRDLLTKEFAFFQNKYMDIAKKVELIYTHQRTTGVVRKFYCNFTLLEKASDNYKNEIKGH